MSRCPRKSSNQLPNVITSVTLTDRVANPGGDDPDPDPTFIREKKKTGSGSDRQEKQDPGTTLKKKWSGSEPIKNHIRTLL